MYISFTLLRFGFGNETGIKCARERKEREKRERKTEKEGKREENTKKGKGKTLVLISSFKQCFSS